MLRPPRSGCLALAALVLVATASAAQTGANVLVVANEGSPASLRIAERYVDRRTVPPDQLLRIKTPLTDEISRPDFERLIQGPVSAWLSKHQAQDRILFIVLIKGIPLRISGTAGRAGTIASVDSELSLLYRRMAGATAGPNGFIPNPYFLGTTPLDKAVRFSHATQDVYLVTRLDGFTDEDALALIERAITPKADGRIILDQRAGLSDVPNQWLADAATTLEAHGFGERLVLDPTSRVVTHEKNVLGYYSWGSNDPARTERQLDIEFAPGAIAGMFVSTDARTFLEPPTTWQPGTVQNGQMYFRGSPQSLTGDLIRAGITGVSGQVAEPYLDNSVRPDILFPAYVAGFSLAEAFYLAVPALSWQTIVIGDPLCAPFPGRALAAADLDPPIDPATELPAEFAARRLASAGLKTSQPAALARVVQGQSRQARDDPSGARESYEAAVSLDDSLNDVWRGLASLYEELEDHDRADDVYRKLLERDRNDSIALNNLAYSLAVRHNRLDEARPLAERANLIAPRSATIYDTLGWIKHLMGEHADAARMLVTAAASLPQNAEVQLHAAAALASAGRLADAAKMLKVVDQLDPRLRDRPEYNQALSLIARE